MESLLLVPEPPSPSRTPKEKRAGRHWALPLSQLLEYHLQATMSTAQYQEACYGVSNYLHACLLLVVLCPAALTCGQHGQLDTQNLVGSGHHEGHEMALSSQSLMSPGTMEPTSQRKRISPSFPRQNREVK